MTRIIKFVVLDILKNKIVLIYTILLFALCWSVFSLEDNATKGLLTLLNVIVLTTPLISVIFSTIYIYNSSEFIELLVSQPIKRKKIWRNLFAGLGLSLVLAFLVGAGIPILLFQPTAVGAMMVVMGCMISLVFTAIAFCCSMFTRDKAKGIGASILLWLWLTLLFDGLILFLLFQFSDYPIEKISVVVTALNPVDLARIMILLQLDVSAMMGYTGAIFKNFFGTSLGLVLTCLILVMWILIPYWVSLRRFIRKDL
jgi:Cu-processing system permease protein